MSKQRLLLALTDLVSVGTENLAQLHAISGDTAQVQAELDHQRIICALLAVEIPDLIGATSRFDAYWDTQRQDYLRAAEPSCRDRIQACWNRHGLERFHSGSGAKEEARSAVDQGWIAILGVAVVVSYLYVSVVPKFSQMFAALGGKLPWTTIQVLGLSQLLQAWLIPLILVLGGLGLWRLRAGWEMPSRFFYPVMALLVILGLAIPIGIFYPILELQQAVRG